MHDFNTLENLERLILSNLVFLNFAVKGRAIYTQGFSAAGYIPVVIRQYLADVHLFYFFQAIVSGGQKGVMAQNG
jgi:hypothetical protein